MTNKMLWGQGLSQNDLMERDTVLVLDNADNIIGSASKKDSHVFDAKQPHGILHRAFSVFLFDESDGRLLLHQRAAEKITFPNVCTHKRKKRKCPHHLAHFYVFLFFFKGLDQYVLLASSARHDTLGTRHSQ